MPGSWPWVQRHRPNPRAHDCDVQCLPTGDRAHETERLRHCPGQRPEWMLCPSSAVQHGGTGCVSWRSLYISLEKTANARRCELFCWADHPSKLAQIRFSGRTTSAGCGRRNPPMPCRSGPRDGFPRARWRASAWHRRRQARRGAARRFQTAGPRRSTRACCRHRSDCAIVHGKG